MQGAIPGPAVTTIIRHHVPTVPSGSPQCRQPELLGTPCVMVELKSGKRCTGLTAKLTAGPVVRAGPPGVQVKSSSERRGHRLHGIKSAIVPVSQAVIDKAELYRSGGKHWLRLAPAGDTVHMPRNGALQEPQIPVSRKGPNPSSAGSENPPPHGLAAPRYPPHRRGTMTGYAFIRCCGWSSRGWPPIHARIPGGRHRPVC